MGFGKKKSTPAPKEPTPKIVVKSGSGAGVTDGTTVQHQSRVEQTPDQSSLLASQYEEDERLRKGVG